MDDLQMAYNGEFSIAERKAMTAYTLQELRKAKKFSQKEVAAHLKIPATTYNTYESGRTEPPIEILVRLSHLYGMPIDLIVQRDRTYRSTEDVSRQIAEYRAQLAEFDKQLQEQGPADPMILVMRETLERLANAMETYSQTEAMQKALRESLPD